ncbi:MAG: hypothetical protein OXC07_11440 [Kistimonas sp.]|nr:hypothetical protein [Kistimonas sp.]
MRAHNACAPINSDRYGQQRFTSLLCNEYPRASDFNRVEVSSCQGAEGKGGAHNQDVSMNAHLASCHESEPKTEKMCVWLDAKDLHKPLRDTGMGGSTADYHGSRALWGSRLAHRAKAGGTI